jgi:dolichyl-diphosphooligosaccharide--protein glycosyltransferase
LNKKKKRQQKKRQTKRHHLSVGASAPPALLDSLLFKLSYFRFDQVFSDPTRPSGWDRARRTEMGGKKGEAGDGWPSTSSSAIHLRHFEEVFTSDHWMVRLYRLKQPDNRQRDVAHYSPF